MIQVFDANAHLRQDLNRVDDLASLSPRFIYERVNASPDVQVWVWDGPRNNERRRALFPGYKVRDYTGQENVFQGLEVYKTLLTYSKAIQITVPDYEADDVCATLARRYAAQGLQVRVHTNDFDFHQLRADPRITVHGIPKDIPFEPRFTFIYKALRGDNSDKIPGLPGFGPKSWESFRDLYEALDIAMRNRDVEALLAMPWKKAQKAWLMVPGNAELLFVYYQITQMLDVPMDLIEKHMVVGTPNPMAAQQLFSRFML